VEEVAAGLLPFMDKPFAFFGHSMGAMIAFELARRLRRTGGSLPVHLFLSGSGSPHHPTLERHIYDLPEPELLEELRRLNGTPKGALDNPELMQLLLPVIRADFAVCQTYVAAEEPPLECPLTVFGGLQDTDVTRESLTAWRQQTTGSFSLWMLQGDHFFLHASQAKLHEILYEALADMTDRLPAGAGSFRGAEGASARTRAA
jgi:medium-chain acyl-[acyl-carrier-protein] hydrolase